MPRKVISEIARLKSAFIERQETIEMKGFRYRRHEKEERATGMPYCPLCIQKSGLFVHIASVVLSEKIGRQDICPNCKSNFGSVTEYI